jgi:hypothetical protein
MMINLQHEISHMHGFGGPRSLLMPRNIVNGAMYVSALKSLSRR